MNCVKLRLCIYFLLVFYSLFIIVFFFFLLFSFFFFFFFLYQVQFYLFPCFCLGSLLLWYIYIYIYISSNIFRYWNSLQISTCFPAVNVLKLILPHPSDIFENVFISYNLWIFFHYFIHIFLFIPISRFLCIHISDLPFLSHSYLSIYLSIYLYSYPSLIF